VVGTKFNNSFQIGMLASFESFMETAKVVKGGEGDSVFDDPEQAEEEESRQGADVPTVNELARAYRRKFGHELPHPKMDAVAERLWRSVESGEKALVFVRRVASVKELKAKLDRLYDDWLIAQLKARLSPGLRTSLEHVVARYEDLRRRRRTLALDGPTDVAGAADDQVALEPSSDRGGRDSFFAWFIRGIGDDAGVLSGGALRERFSQPASVFGTFLEDNYVAALLGVPPGEVVQGLAGVIGKPSAAVRDQLDEDAGQYVRDVKKRRRLDVFLAVQRAALELLAKSRGPLAENAEVLLDELFGRRPGRRGAVRLRGAADAVEGATLFTLLRARPALEQALLPVRQGGSFRERLKEREVRRALMSAQLRLGHPFIDLYVISVNRFGRLDSGQRERAGVELQIGKEFLDELERQARENRAWSGFRELADAAEHLPLILSLNLPDVLHRPLPMAPTLFGRLLREQQPIAGMFGEVNKTLVGQFRMPGYPRVLISTDLLQEGEDLHAFCRQVYHYGLPWMPSSLEQRVGRVDRVGSLNERRLRAANRVPTGDEKLQVFFPYLRETVERVQAYRVFARVNRFLYLMHESLAGDGTATSTINLGSEILDLSKCPMAPTETLRTAFGIQPWMLDGEERPLEVSMGDSRRLVARVERIRKALEVERRYQLAPPTQPGVILGTIAVGKRWQPFTVFPRSIDGQMLLRCVSPVGILESLKRREIASEATVGGTRLCTAYDSRFDEYDFTVEADVMLVSAETDMLRVRWLIGKVVKAAERLEERFIRDDQLLDAFREALKTEAAVER